MCRTFRSRSRTWCSLLPNHFVFVDPSFFSVDFFPFLLMRSNRLSCVRKLRNIDFPLYERLSRANALPPNFLSEFKCSNVGILFLLGFYMSPSSARPTGIVAIIGSETNEVRDSGQSLVRYTYFMHW